MFAGYFGRRRFKSILAVFLGFLVLIALLYKTPKQEHQLYTESPRPIQIQKTPSPPLAPIKKRPGVMSLIEFKNSPYLVFRSLPTNFIPIMILSKAANIEVRDAIRRTWGFYRSYRNDTLRMKVFFLVGTDDFMTHRILTEQNVFDDVIQITVPDMYSFSAYKELSAMVWVRSYLPDIPFYIKTEDDVIINMKILVDRLLPMIESIANQKLIVGWFASENVVPRGSYQKFIDAVMTQTNGEVPYAMSLLYAVTAIGADRMIDTISKIEHIDYPGDPFVTGILRDAAEVQITNLSRSPENFKYELANGGCRRAFEKNHNLLMCTSSLHVGPIVSMMEYFEAWNVLIGQPQP
ncbi:unnamed protein product [Rotaria sordida]|uniref:Hexosyltransferase n=1 Tax=Rotaria sordida TaxID=392033 RepID=A0A818HT68_9BILA|nr:unnamed protein product [Rotaria sordida]CAF1010769.1 unnamed protein product [Rotaria sordida]CAF3513814.1 unnamed protein product [Rotaria sordida]